MLPSTIRRWLLRATIFTLSLTFVFSLAALIPTAGAHAQQTKLGPISVQSVYTTDQNQNSKTVFAPGDNIGYHVDVDNNSGAVIPVDVQFEVFATDYDPILYPYLYSYNQTYHVAQMPTGLTRFYNPTTIPSSAAPATYDVRITVTPSNSASPANDGDWGENTFIIQHTTESAMNFCTQYLPKEPCMVITGEVNATQQQLQEAKQILDGAGQVVHDAICNEPGRVIVFGPNDGLANFFCGA